MLNKLEVAGRTLQVLGESRKSKTKDMTRMQASLTINFSIIITFLQDILSFDSKFHIL